MLFLYILIVLSPLSRSLVRMNPDIAVWFYPPLFSFSEVFYSGTVGIYKIGDNSEKIIQTITQKGNEYFVRNCEHEDIGEAVMKTACFYIIFEDQQEGMTKTFQIKDYRLFSIRLVYWKNLDDILLCC